MQILVQLIDCCNSQEFRNTGESDDNNAMMMRISFSWMMKDAGKVALKLLQCFLHVRSHHLPLQVFITIYSCNILCGNFQHINLQDVSSKMFMMTHCFTQVMFHSFYLVLKSSRKTSKLTNLPTNVNLILLCLCTDCTNDKCERIGEECVIKIDAIDAEALAIKSELYSFGSKKFSSASAFDNEISPNYVKVEDTAAT